MPRGEKDRCWFRPAEAKLIRFTYENWRGSVHEYVVEPEAVSFGLFDSNGAHPDSPNREDNIQAVMHGNVVTRDGDTRPDMDTRRRTFLVRKMRKITIMEKER